MDAGVWQTYPSPFFSKDLLNSLIVAVFRFSFVVDDVGNYRQRLEVPF